MRAVNTGARFYCGRFRRPPIMFRRRSYALDRSIAGPVARRGRSSCTGPLAHRSHERLVMDVRRSRIDLDRVIRNTDSGGHQTPAPDYDAAYLELALRTGLPLAYSPALTRAGPANAGAQRSGTLNVLRFFLETTYSL
jgi:hypothetical protein